MVLLSLTQTTTAIDPPLGNSPTMHSGVFCKDLKILLCLRKKIIAELQKNPTFHWEVLFPRCDRHTYIHTYRRTLRLIERIGLGADPLKSGDIIFASSCPDFIFDKEYSNLKLNVFLVFKNIKYRYKSKGSLNYL